MKIRQFVSVSSLLLATWLGATFFQKVPAHRYPQLGKGHSSSSSAVIDAPRSSDIAHNGGIAARTLTH